MVEGHKEKGVFHPHGSKSGIHSNSINESSGVTLEVKRGNKKIEVKERFTPLQKSILKKLEDVNAVLSKSEIQTIKNALNSSSVSSKVFGKLADEKLWNNHDTESGFAISSEQTKQGLDWLKKSPQKNTMGYREQNVVDNFKEFRLIGFKDNANYYQAKMGIGNYLPVYDVLGKDGSSFEYYMDNEGLHITG